MATTTTACQHMLKLIEECSEVQHVACKILKYGYAWMPEAHYPDKKAALLAEIADLKEAILAVESDLSTLNIDKS